MLCTGHLVDGDSGQSIYTVESKTKPKRNKQTNGNAQRLTRTNTEYGVKATGSESEEKTMGGPEICRGLDRKMQNDAEEMKDEM